MDKTFASQRWVFLPQTLMFILFLMFCAVHTSSGLLSIKILWGHVDVYGLFYSLDRIVYKHKLAQ